MLKLIKYDFRRSRDRILAYFVIAILVHAATWYWNRHMGVQLVAINLTTYVVVGISLLLTSAITFGRNLKSYHRRLLPVSSLYTILSPLLLCWTLLLSVVIIATLHLGIYILVYSADFLPGNFWPVALNCILQLIWFSGLMLISIMFAITVANSVRVRGKIWIIIAVLVVLQNGLSYLEQLMFKSSLAGVESMFEFDVLDADSVRSGITFSYPVLNYWPMLFEAAVAVILIYAMNVLLKRRVEA
ncbi:hypothetical protein H70357_16200 [Paenibacillus sp. FSL H7-0357]|uniref:hypothetical protein n=1 Tax=Paenibacillus sp. FSL H7-0357 TaxID=1536774 RepID=UPI0004F6BDCB|nr:hypothetical protein [Paenibacillus sp. FSL H7-0357]AIQ18048.1 hypothetical protein H70357_16200 [Paenibacillus sp. FSL H7-0357]